MPTNGNNGVNLYSVFFILLSIIKKKQANKWITLSSTELAVSAPEIGYHTQNQCKGMKIRTHAASK